jgi:hypothetical protein
MSSAAKRSETLMQRRQDAALDALASLNLDGKNTITISQPIFEAAIFLLIVAYCAGSVTERKLLKRICPRLQNLDDYETARQASARKASSKRRETGRSKRRSAAGSRAAND